MNRDITILDKGVAFELASREKKVFIGKYTLQGGYLNLPSQTVPIQTQFILHMNIDAFHLEKLWRTLKKNVQEEGGLNTLNDGIKVIGHTQPREPTHQRP